MTRHLTLIIIIKIKVGYKMKYLLLFIFSLNYICSNGQYSKIAELLFPLNDKNEEKVIIDSFQNGDSNYNYLYGHKHQPNCKEIIILLAKIRSENNYDSIQYLEEIYLTYLNDYKVNWNQPYSIMGSRYTEFKDLLISFRMTFLDAGMKLLNWNITQKFAYLKSQEVDGWFEKRVNTQSLEKLLFKDGKKPEWFVEFDSSQLYRISALDSIKSFFPVLFQNNYNQFLTIESYKLLEEQFPMYAECIYSEMESQKFFDNSNFIGKRGFEFNLLKIISKTNYAIDTFRLNKILVRDFIKFMNGGIYFRDIFIKYADEYLVEEYCKEIVSNCASERWKFLWFPNESIRENYLNNKIGIYLLENSDQINCKIIGLNRIKSPNSLEKIKMRQLQKKEKNKIIKNMILEKLS